MYDAVKWLESTKELLGMRYWELEPAHFGKGKGAATPTNVVWCGDQMQPAHVMLQKKALSITWACLSQFADFLEKYKAMYREVSLKNQHSQLEFLGIHFKGILNFDCAYPACRSVAIPQPNHYY